MNREVTSKDVKYAIERGFNKDVANGYARAYFGNLEGAPEAAKKADGEPIIAASSRPTTTRSSSS